MLTYKERDFFVSLSKKKCGTLCQTQTSFTAVTFRHPDTRAEAVVKLEPTGCDFIGSDLVSSPESQLRSNFSLFSGFIFFLLDSTREALHDWWQNVAVWNAKLFFLFRFDGEIKDRLKKEPNWKRLKTLALWCPRRSTILLHCSITTTHTNLPNPTSGTHPSRCSSVSLFMSICLAVCSWPFCALCSTVDLLAIKKRAILVWYTLPKEILNIKSYTFWLNKG